MSKDTTPLEVDIDTRLAELWAMAWSDEMLGPALDADDELARQVGAVVRAAYGRGYCDALKEERMGRRAELARTHGYRAP